MQASSAVGSMRASRSRILALLMVAVLSFPLLPYEFLGGSDSAEAQAGIIGGIPPEVSFRDWDATHRLVAHNLPEGEPCTVQAPNPNAPGAPPVVGDRACQIHLNTVPAPNTEVNAFTVRATEDTANLDNPAASPPDEKIAWLRLTPALAHPIKVEGLKAKVYVEFDPPLQSCQGLTGSLGRVTAIFEVRVLDASDNGETGDAGQQIARVRRDNMCPVDESPGGGSVGGEVGHKWPIEVDLPLLSQNVNLGVGYKLQFKVSMARPLGSTGQGPGTWRLDYDSERTATYLEVRSPNAFQYAAWMQDQTNKVTNIFAVPVNPADRFSAVGFFAFKTAWGGYDNPEGQSATPQVTDAKWRMRIRAPNGNLVSLQDHCAFPDTGGAQGACSQGGVGAGPNHEFNDCDNQDSDTVVCLVQSLRQPETVRIFRMPDRTGNPPTPVWNYTRATIESIAGSGGEFKLEILGSVRDNKIETTIPNGGLPFTVGGFGLRLDRLTVGAQSESLVHTVCTSTASPTCRATSTTFLLNLTNIAPKVDNYTLTSQLVTSTPSGWTVSFDGRDVHGTKATVEGRNSSVLRVILTPPAGAAAGSQATARVRIVSDSAPDQFAEKDVTAQVSNTLTRGAGIFVFPDPAIKQVRRGATVTFNYTLWNRGTDTDSFQAFCFDGPDPSVDPATGRRNDDSWNGTLTLGTTTIGCRDLNATRLLTTTIAPGDTAEAVVVLQSSANNTRSNERSVVVSVKSQGDPQKEDRAQAVAQLELRSSFKLFILTDGTANPDNPQAEIKATRTLRYGKDDPAACPNMAVPQNQGCTGNEEGDAFYTNTYVESDDVTEVHKQKLDVQFAEYAFYRITIVNDGDRPQSLNVRIGDVKNTTESNCGVLNAFDAVKPNEFGIGMNDAEGVMLLRRPIFNQNVTAQDPDRIASGVSVLPGRSAVFYLRVHMEWNRLNLSDIATGGSTLGGGKICNSISTVDVTVTDALNPPFPSKTVRAETRGVNDDPLSAGFTKNIVVTEGERCALNANAPNCLNQGAETFDAQALQACPPVTAPDSSDVRLCRYVRPGQTQAWFFTADKFWAIGDEFDVRPVLRTGGLSLTDLKNRGWRFGCDGVDRDIPCVVQNTKNPGRANASGDEITVRLDVTVPLNASISDFADLQMEIGGVFGGRSKVFSFLTITAQRFKVNATRLGGDVFIHPGDRAAINLNVSNEGSLVERYSIALAPGTTLPTGWGVAFQPNETRVSPAKNKTATLFVTAPLGSGCNVLPSPASVTGNIRVRSLTNLSEVRGETFADVPFTVGLKPCGAEDIKLTVQGAEVRPVDSGGTVPFTLNVSNPAPTAKVVVIRRLPTVDEIPGEFVKGWRDVIAETCLDMPARIAPGQPSNKSVAFSVTAAPDALEGTHVTYVLRADEFAGSLDNCRTATTIPDNDNFAQALVTATVIGTVGLEVQAQPEAQILRADGSRVTDFNAPGVAVVPRSGSVLFPVRVRNVGTANDTMVFQANLVNQSQVLGANPWRVQVERGTESPGCLPTFTRPGVLQSLGIDPQFSCIVFVNVSVPLNIPLLGQHADVDLVVRATSPATPPSSLRLTAYVQDYDIRVRVTNTTVDAVPGQTLNFLLNITNAGDCPRLCAGIDTFDIQVDVGGLAGFWNVTSEFSAITLLNGTSRDVQIAVQVPRVRPDSAPTTGAVLGITVRSRQVEQIKPAAESLGAGNPLTQYLIGVPKTLLVTVNLFPYVSFDVDDDKELELAVDRNRNNLDGFEFFSDPFTAIIQSVDLLAADGDEDGRVDHFIDRNLDGRPDRFWDPDDNRLTVIQSYPDINNDGALEFLYDSDGDLAVDHWIDPATRQAGVVIAKDFDDDGSAEFLIDTNTDGRPDRYFDADRGPRGLVTTVQLSAGSSQRYEIDTNGGGRPTKVYDRVTGEVSDARVFGVLEFAGTYWYLVLLFLAVAVLAGYLVVQRRRGPKPPGQAPPPQQP